MHLIKPVNGKEYQYKYFFVDVKGGQRIYLENTDAASKAGLVKKKTTIFGINWGG